MLDDGGELIVERSVAGFEIRGEVDAWTDGDHGVELAPKVVSPLQLERDDIRGIVDQLLPLLGGGVIFAVVTAVVLDLLGHESPKIGGERPSGVDGRCERKWEGAHLMT